VWIAISVGCDKSYDRVVELLAHHSRIGIKVMTASCLLMKEILFLGGMMRIY